LYDKSWGAEDDSDISGVSDKDTITSNKQNVSYFESIDRYLTLSYKKIDWDDRQAYIRYINDVTELVNGEKNNQLTMKQLDKALAHANLIYFNYDIKSKLIHVNKAGKESLDLDFGEEFVTFEKTFEIFHPEFIDAYKESFYRILSGRNDYISFDSKIKFKTDGYSWREVKMSAIYDDESSRTKIIITCNDINRFKKLESRFITILDKNNITSWEYNIEKDEITMNKNLFNVITDYQVEPREFYRKKIHPDDLKIFDGIFEEIKNGAMQASGEYRSRPNKKSDWLWSHTEMTFLEKENKDMNIALGSSRDITKFKLAEKRYQDELSFQKIRNSSQLIYAIVNITKDNKILEFSSTDDRIASIDKSELIDRFYASIIDEKVSHDIQENYVKTLSSNFQKGISENQKTLRMNIFGKRLYIKLKFTIIQNPETNDLMAFVGGENVDLDVKNEQMLKLSSDQSYELFTRMDFTNDEMIAHRTDDSFYQFEGHTLVTSIEDSLMDLSIALNVPFQRAQILEGVYNNMLEKKDSAITIFKLKNEKGEERIKRAKIIRIEGEPRVFAEFWDDITELTKENEDRNKELAEALEFAQSANIAKTTFLSAMSHDIRTPLNAIIGMNDLALDNIDDKQQVLQSLNIIKDSSRHLLSLINDILDMSRIESNKIVFNNLPYDAREVLNEIFDRMRALMNQKNQNLEVDLDIKNPFIIFDKVVFSKILENVINNSIKFSPESATIKVGVQDIESTDDSKYNQWKIIIEDNGIGMDEEGLENAFNPFYRASTSDVNNIEGTGLGLPIVKKNLAIMGGTINMESELSKGTKTIIEVSFKTQDCNKSKKEVVHKKHSE
ncbi:MAG: HAMP domain-containing sensor histidine kinase, partial [Sphaerochaetaceae bacterium]